MSPRKSDNRDLVCARVMVNSGADETCQVFTDAVASHIVRLWDIIPLRDNVCGDDGFEQVKVSRGII